MFLLVEKQRICSQQKTSLKYICKQSSFGGVGFVWRVPISLYITKVGRNNPWKCPLQAGFGESSDRTCQGMVPFCWPKTPMEKIKEFESLKICKNLPVTRHTAMKNHMWKIGDTSWNPEKWKETRIPMVLWGSFLRIFGFEPCSKIHFADFPLIPFCRGNMPTKSKLPKIKRI